MASMSRRNQKAIATLIISACLVASIYDSFFLLSSSSAPGVELEFPDEEDDLLTADKQLLSYRRSLLQIGEGGGQQQQPPLASNSVGDGDVSVATATEAGEEESGAAAVDMSIYPWAQSNLRPLSRAPDHERETVLFWHIPKSGGSTAKAIYRCLGKSIDIESQPSGILAAEKLGLVPSGKVDIIFSSFPDFAVEHLFDPLHKGRMLAMFRHPVDRLISKFFYLQIATWEKTYRPEWNDMDILTWVRGHNMDNDHMVKKLAGKLQRDTATEQDLARAKVTVKRRFVVGLMQHMEESVHRFNRVVGVDEGNKRGRRCMDQYFGKSVRKQNSNSHPKVDKGSAAWDLLAEKNSLDIQLYEYVLELWEEQKKTIDSYATSTATTNVGSSSASAASPSSSSVSAAVAAPATGVMVMEA